MREALVLRWLLPDPCQSRRVEPGMGFTRTLAPRAAVRPRPLQHRQFPVRSGVLPRAVVLLRPPQYRQVPACSSAATRPLIPRAVLRPRPLQHLQVPALSGGQ